MTASWVTTAAFCRELIVLPRGEVVMIANAMKKRMTEPADGKDLVERALRQAVEKGASDIHVEPTAEGHEIKMRVDGLLETIERIDSDSGRSVVGRLMVMAHLLTYRMDVPQEGKATVG